MTQPTDHSTPPASTEPHTQPPRQTRRWIWIIVAAVLIVGATATYLLVPSGDREGRLAQQQQRQRLLQLGAALRQYASDNDGALPEAVPANLSITATDGTPIDRATLLSEVATGRPITYGISPSDGPRIRYEPYGEHFVAWTELDARGARCVLLNSLDEAGYIHESKLDMTKQRTLTGTALNRIAPIEEATEGDADEGEEDSDAPEEEGEQTTAPADSIPTPSPTTEPADAPR